MPKKYEIDYYINFTHWEAKTAIVELEEYEYECIISENFICDVELPNGKTIGSNQIISIKII